MPSRAHTLRFKLALWFVLVFFVIQSIMIGGVVVFRREAIGRVSNTKLSESAAAMVDSLLAAEVEWKLDQVRPLLPVEAGFVLYAVRDYQGAELTSWNVADIRDLPLSDLQRIPAGPVGGVHSIVTSERAEVLTGQPGRLRLITLPFRYRGGDYFFQAAVRDRTTLVSLLGPYFDLVSIGVPVGVLAAAIAAWIIAGRAVSPMDRISLAARDVSPTSLNERFEVGATDDEVARLEAELNSALARLEAGYRAQDQFLTNASHELKTPIAVLLTQAQVAKMGERSADKCYAFVDKTESVMKRLGKLVESMLLLARADLAESPPRDSVAMIDVILGCLQSCQLLAQQGCVSLVPNLVDAEDGSSGLVIEGDAELLQTMVENLVRNAIAHSPRGSLVAIDVDGSGDEVEIAIRDQGPGIPEDYIDRIFDRFIQAPKKQARRDGTGLGLAIARSITQLHRGTIRAHNNEGDGCSFIVTLPKHLREAEAPTS